MSVVLIIEPGTYSLLSDITNSDPTLLLDSYRISIARSFITDLNKMVSEVQLLVALLTLSRARRCAPQMPAKTILDEHLDNANRRRRWRVLSPHLARRTAKLLYSTYCQTGPATFR